MNWSLSFQESRLLLTGSLFCLIFGFEYGTLEIVFSIISPKELCYEQSAVL